MTENHQSATSVSWGRQIYIAVALAMCGVLFFTSTSTAEAAVEWDAEVFQAPTRLQPGEEGMIRILGQNEGTTPSTALPSVSFELPTGVSLSSGSLPRFWTCTGSPVTTCTNMFAAISSVKHGTYLMVGGGLPAEIYLTVDVDSSAAAGVHSFDVTMSGGGDSGSVVESELRVGGPPLGFGPTPGTFDAVARDGAGELYTQAGGTPYDATTGFEYNTKFIPIVDPGDETLSVQAEGRPKDVVVELPAGFMGDPGVGPKCQDLGRVVDRTCADATQLGIAEISPPAGTGGRTRMFGIYNVEPPTDKPAQFAFQSPVGTIVLSPTLRSDGDYGLNVTVRNITQADTLFASRVTLWGVPSDPSHDAQRCASPNFVLQACVGYDELNQGLNPPGSQDPSSSGAPERPFLRNPTECNGEPVETHLHLSSYEDPASFRENGEDPDLSDPAWKSATAEAPPVTGCGNLQFNPDIEVKPTSSSASSPTGLDVEITTPQNSYPNGLATAHLKDTTVILPEGMAVNPSSADGLASCSPKQIGLVQKSPVVLDKSEANCPQGSKIGTVAIDTPLLEDPLNGSVFIAKQGDNPFDSLLALYIVVEGPGLIVKLPGEVTLDGKTGQISTTFLDNPQVPFETLRLRLKGGSRAPLMTPATCGAHTTETEMVSWADPDIDPADLVDTFEISKGCDQGGFEPKLTAGTVNPAAGEYSPFVTRFTREDGEEEIKSLNVALPEGLTGKLAGIPYCSDQALASFGSDGITDPGTAQGEIDDPTCPEASQVGRVTVGAGAGSSPFYLQTGKAYLAGPYKGAPLSLAIVTPAKAGPFDLGSVMVRSALHVNDRTAQITVESDAIPTMLEGIPLKIKDLRVIMDRPEFTLNPTNCQATKVWALAQGTGGTHANLDNRFQAADCATLGFAPRFGMRIMNRGRKSTVRSFNPRMRFTVAPRAGEANIDRAAVTLPPSLILDQGNLDTICTRAQFAVRDCPEGSVVGFARAWSPLLDRPVRGRVYLGSSTNQLPDLIADLQGQVGIVLQGRIDSVKGRIRNTFDVVPDVPVTRFQLDMRGGKQRGILVNSTDQCRNTKRAVANFRGQNGIRSLTRPRLGLRFKGCNQVRKKAARKNAARKASANRARRSRN